MGRKTIVLLIAVAFVGLPGTLTAVRSREIRRTKIRDKGGKQMNRNTAQIGDKYARINGRKWDKGGSYK